MIDSAQKQRSKDALVSSLQRFSDAGGSLIQIRTREPLRAGMLLREHFATSGNPYAEWSASTGFRRFTTENYLNNALEGKQEDFVTALGLPVAELRSSTSEVRAKSDVVHYFAYLDPAPHLTNNPYALDLVLQYASILPTSNVAILFITPDAPLEMLPSGTCLVTELPTPTVEELDEVLRKMLDTATSDTKTFTGGHNLDDDDIRRASVLGLGLALAEFETHVALSIIAASEAEEDTLSIDYFLEGIAKGKTEVVRQSEILELVPAEDIANVGGMQRLKDWVNQRSNCYSAEAKEYGIEPPKGLVLVGVPGCLSGDTVVDYKRGSRPSGRSISLRDLHDKFNGIPTSTRPWEDRTKPTFLHSVDSEGRVFFNRVIAVLDSGVKETVRVSFEDGTHLVLTPDHPILNTEWEFVDASLLSPGDTVLARGSMKATAGQGRDLGARPPRRVINVRNHPHGSIKSVQDGEFFYEYKRVARARLVVEAHMNGMAYEEFLRRLNGPSTVMCSLRFLDPVYEVHHVDEDTMNDALSNLVVMHKVEHARHHGKLENLNVEYTRVLTVASVEPHGEVHTYDVQMEAPANNFVANGVIVHNTGKSLVAKAVASVLGIPLVRLDIARVFSKYVGDSEQRMRSSLSMVEAMAPCVLFVDEIDKGLGGIGQGGDSGTSMRVLGSYLTWLQELRAPVFNMVTANRVTGLPPELLRRGRFDQIFSVSMPNEAERVDVLAIHLRKRGRKLADFTDTEVKSYLRASRDYVPAEIESAVKDALISSYSADEEFAMQHLLDALANLVPMSKSHADQIEGIVRWAEQNAIPVNYPVNGDVGNDAIARRVILPSADPKPARRPVFTRNAGSKK